MAKVNKHGIPDHHWRKLPKAHKEAIKNAPTKCGSEISPSVLPGDAKGGK